MRKRERAGREARHGRERRRRGSVVLGEKGAPRNLCYKRGARDGEREDGAKDGKNPPCWGDKGRDYTKFSRKKYKLNLIDRTSDSI